METFFFVAKKWLMFSDFSWELWNIFQTVFRPKIPKTKPFKAAHSYMALREYSLGAARVAAMYWIIYDLAYVIVLAVIRIEKEMVLCDFLERFQSHSETLWRFTCWWRPSWIYTQGDQLENLTILLSCVN